jgi:hypothetical protein
VPLEEFTRRMYNSTEINIRATAQSLVDIPFLIQGTEMIATIPKRIATSLGSFAELKMYPVPVRIPETREVLIWHKRNEPDPGHRLAARDHSPRSRASPEHDHPGRTD